ncbi:MAG: hypothetical protein ACKV2T_25465 [Kofleriaceae bacterium]
MFGATQMPDTAGAIAKLEAESAPLPKAERRLATRALALARFSQSMADEPDRMKSRQLQVQLTRDTITLLDEMSAFGPDDLELQAMVSGRARCSRPTSNRSRSLTTSIPECSGSARA